jgi:shikimate dehydrogenase
MRVFGLIGFPLGHSFSPVWFNQRFAIDGLTDAIYNLFPIQSIHDFPKLLLNEPELNGLNVTIPYKEKIIPFLDEVDERAQAIGAVNTIKISRRDGRLHAKGFNTDSPGFRQTLEGLTPGCSALILGTGGAAKAVAYALRESGVPYTYVSRIPYASGMLSYDDLDQETIRKNLLIVNTTPLGMHPDIESYPAIPFQHLTTQHLLYDLVYNPPLTEFLKKGAFMMSRTINGQQMLENQAELSYRIFTRL